MKKVIFALAIIALGTMLAACEPMSPEDQAGVQSSVTCMLTGKCQ